MHLKQSKTPHFMSPTIASTHGQPLGTTLKAAKINTPSGKSTTISTKKKRNWVASAVKRVGMSRSSNQKTPSLGSAEPSALEKMTTESSHVENKGPSTPNTAFRDKSLPTSKPLPSPPVASDLQADEHSGSRSLVDASEKPLRRSPPGKPTEEEEWPTIYPERVSTPTGPQRFPFQGTEAQPITDAVQRYPKLSSAVSGQASTITSATAGVNSFRRKPVAKVSRPEPGMAFGNHKASAAASSPGTGGVKKSRNFSQPRQTRTSSLRARLSLSGAPGEITTTNKATDVVNSTISKDMSELNQLGSSNVSQGPGKPTTHTMSYETPGASSRKGRTSSGARNVIDFAQSGHTNVPLFSKEPVSTSSVPMNQDDSPADKGKSELLKLIPTDGLTSSGLSSGTDGVGLFHGVGSDMHLTSQLANGPLEEVLPEYTEDSVAKTVEETTPPGYTLKRLSKVTPEYGPTLLISPNADEVIMGTPSSDGENKGNVTDESSEYDSRRTQLTDEFQKVFRGTKIPTAINKHSSLPLSTSGDLLSRTPRVSTTLREKKARSVDAELLLSRAENDSFTEGNKSVTTRATQPKEWSASVPLSRVLSKRTGKSSVIQDISSDGPADSRSCPATGQSNRLTLASHTAAVQEAFSKAITSTQDPCVGKYDNQKSMKANAQDATAVNATNAGSRNHNRHGGFFTDMSTGNKGKLSGGYLDDTALPPPSTPSFGSQAQEGSPWPTRSSSKVPGSEYKTPPYISTQPTQGRIVDPRLSKDFRLMAETFDTPIDMTSTPPEPETEISKRTSQASKQSSQGSYTKNVLSMANIRGLFRKGHGNSKAEENQPVPSSKASRKYNISTAGSPFSIRAEPSTTGARSRERSTPATSAPSPNLLQVPGLTNSPTIDSPASNQVEETTNLAMDILESARSEENGPRKEQLFKMGKIMVDVITQARDAEKAMEEARVAADKAQMAYMMTKRKVFDVAKMIEEWKKGLDAEG